MFMGDNKQFFLRFSWKNIKLCKHKNNNDKYETTYKVKLNIFNCDTLK